MTDRIDGAAAYKPDRTDPLAFQTPEPVETVEVVEIVEVIEDRDVAESDTARPYRQAAVAAGAFGLGYLAYRGLNALFRRSDDAGRIAPEPLETSTGPVKDNAAPRFAGGTAAPEKPASPNAPFIATSAADDTGGLAVDPAAGRDAAAPEHVPTDLLGDRAPGSDDRAPEAFRPDPTAPVPPGMRDSLRPATGPAPGFAANRGDFASGLSQTDGSK